VILIGTGADHNIVRRVCAWDASDNTNNGVWGVHKNTGNLLEDVCGFGSGRKIFSNSQRGDNVTIRRAWGRWERSLYDSPKVTFANGYNSINSTYENVIGTWDETAMGGVLPTQPLAILRIGPITSSSVFCQNNKYLGSIAYIRAADKVARLNALVLSDDEGHCLRFQDTVVYADPGTHTNLRAFNLTNDPIGDDKVLTNTTVIGGTESKIMNQWQVSSRVDAATGAASDIWNGSGSQGARVCKRYVNGKLTNEPLWPWPMNQRIINAMRQAGKAPVDVTRTMEEMFGPIPSECRGSVSSPSASPLPTPPVSLGVDVRQ
jgi:hypothetical protein